MQPYFLTYDLTRKTSVVNQLHQLKLTFVGYASVAMQEHCSFNINQLGICSVHQKRPYLPAIHITALPLNIVK